MVRSYTLTEHGLADLRAMYTRMQQMYDETLRMVRGDVARDGALNYYNGTKIRNSSGSNVPRGGVLEIDDEAPINLTANDMRRGSPFLKGISPQSAELDKTKYAIALEPIVAGEIGPAAMQGIVQANIYVTNEADEFASPTDGETAYVTSAETGLFRILEKDAGTGLVKGTLLIQYPMSETDTIPVYNNDSETAIAGGFARITGWNAGQSAYNITRPISTDLSPVWVIVDSAIAAGTKGTGRIFKNTGLTFAYDAAEGTPAYGEMWGPQANSWQARKFFEGMHVLKDGVGLQRWTNEVVVELREELAQGESTQATVMMRNDTKLVNAGFTITVYDAFLNKEETIEKKTRGIARWMYGRWLLVSAYCAPDDTENKTGESYGGAFMTDPNVFFEFNNDAFFV